MAFEAPRRAIICIIVPGQGCKAKILTKYLLGMVL
jgi:hypothetical protein